MENWVKISETVGMNTNFNKSIQINFDPKPISELTTQSINENEIFLLAQKFKLKMKIREILASNMSFDWLLSLELLKLDLLKI